MMIKTRRLGVVWADAIFTEASSRRLVEAASVSESGQRLRHREIEVMTIMDVEIKMRSGAFRDRRSPSALEQSEVSRAVGQGV
jgi:hypothetical protein